MRQREAQLRCRAAALVAVALALAAIAAPAGAETSRFGDIAVTPLPVPTCESTRGYVDYRFTIANRSASEPHEVALSVPGESYGEAALAEVSRSVVVAPGATVTVSLLQCPLGLQGSNAAVWVDGRRQREYVRVNVEEHGIGRYTHRPRDTAITLLASRGVAFPTPDEKSAASLARAEQDVREWSTEWLSYSRYDGIAVSAEEMERMPPPVRLALVRYVECGGALEVVGNWKPPAEWQTADPPGAVVRTYAAGWGTCLVSDRTGFRSTDHSGLLIAAGETATPFRNIRTVEEANRELPVVEDIRVPVRGMLVLMLAFIIVLGPVNLILLGQLNKRIWLLVTVPLLSLLAGALMFGYSIVSEGFEGHCRTSTLTLLDETTGRATSVGWAAYYSPLAAREGLHFSYQTELTPQIAQIYGYMYGGPRTPSGGSRTVDWSQDQHLARGWLAARVPVHFAVRKSEVRRERLAVRTGAGGKVTVVNGLGSPIKQLTLADRDGNLHAAANIPAGAEVALEARGGKAAGRSLRGLYKGRWPSMIATLEAEPQAYLRPQTYVAVLDGSPFSDNAMPDARRQNGLSVVYGILGGRADGN